MKKRVTFLVAVLLFLLPFSAFAQSYVEVKGGGYFPTGDLEDLGYDAGFNGEVAIGHYIVPGMLAVELGTGYFESTLDKGSVTNDPVIGTLSGSIHNKVYAVPVTATLKVRVPVAGFYAGAGGGAYFTWLRVRASGTRPGGGFFSLSGTDSDTVFGGQVMAGISFPIFPRVRFSAEAKYIVTDNAHFFGRDYGNLDGATATGNIGINF